MSTTTGRRWIAALVVVAAAAVLAVAPAPAQGSVTTAAKGPGHCC